MIRIRDIALPPEHNVNQLQFEAAQLLKISASKIRGVKLVKRSVDARKKPDIKIIYTIDVMVDGNEEKLIRKSGCYLYTIYPAFFNLVKQTLFASPYRNLAFNRMFIAAS